MTYSNGLFRAILKSPILWGAAACACFYRLVHVGVLKGQFVGNYFAGHPVEYAATAMFCVGLAALAIKLVDISVQSGRLDEPTLGPIPSGGQPVTDCPLLAARLSRLPAGRQHDSVIRRLREALEYVRRSGSAGGLDEQLRYLADLDASRLHASYGLVRVIIWAIPVLGFLGTVIGITLAIGKLSPEALETSLPEVMTSLSVAFYTTTQALGLSIVLMFAQFLVDRKENALLAEVDQRAEAELVGRFRSNLPEADGPSAAVRQMGEAVIASTEQLVQRQVDLWSAAMDAAQQRWLHITDRAGKQLQTTLSRALGESLNSHAEKLAAQEQLVAEKNRENWQRLGQDLIQCTETVASLRQAVAQEADLIGRVVEAVGQVTSLEEALNRNLQALAGSKNFEETVMSLGAAIHLLHCRLGQVPPDLSAVRLQDTKKTERAA